MFCKVDVLVAVPLRIDVCTMFDARSGTLSWWAISHPCAHRPFARRETYPAGVALTTL
jgi:hypothetical protein